MEKQTIELKISELELKINSFNQLTNKYRRYADMTIECCYYNKNNNNTGCFGCKLAKQCIVLSNEKIAFDNMYNNDLEITQLFFELHPYISNKSKDKTIASIKRWGKDTQKLMNEINSICVLNKECRDINDIHFCTICEKRKQCSITNIPRNYIRMITTRSRLIEPMLNIKDDRGNRLNALFIKQILFD